MGYLHIPNLYKDRDILLFRRCFTLEKIHGTSARLRWNHAMRELRFHPGGGSATTFAALFDTDGLKRVLTDQIGKDTTIYGEFYGGSGAVGMGMAAVYGPTERFVVFDVQIEDCWLSVPKMQAVADKLGLEAVPWEEIDATVEAIIAARDRDSIQAVRNGMGTGHRREGVVVRPLIELTRNNGTRLIAKHRREEFVERASGEPAPTVDPAKFAVLTDAAAVADEWVIPRRLEHVLTALQPPAVSIRDTARVVAAMQADVQREAAGEVVWGKPVAAAVGRKTADLFRARLAAGGDP